MHIPGRLLVALSLVGAASAWSQAAWSERANGACQPEYERWAQDYSRSTTHIWESCPATCCGGRDLWNSFRSGYDCTPNVLKDNGICEDSASAVAFYDCMVATGFGGATICARGTRGYPPPPPPRGAFGSSADMAFSMSDDEATGALIIVVIVVIIVVVVVAVGSSIKRSHRSKAASGQRGAGQCRANSALPPALPHHHRPQVPLVSAQYAGEYSQSYCAPVAVARVDGTKQQLLQLNVKQLRTRAAAIGISSAEVEAARDGDDPKHELVALILSHSR